MRIASSLPPGRGEEVGEHGPLGRREVGLLGQLALAAASGSSPATSSSPAGISHSRVRTGCRYWRIRNTRSSLVEREHGDGAGVVDVLAHDRLRVELERVATDVPDEPVEDPVALPQREVDRLVGERGQPFADVEQQARLLALERRADESAEQRVRVVRAAAELGVRLRADVERVHVARQLDELDEVAVGRHAREHQARVGDAVAVGVVDLVAVAVALADLGGAVELGGDRARRRASPGTGPRRIVPPRSPPAMISTCSSMVAITGNCVSGSNSLDEAPCEADDVARVLDDHALQAEAQAERRDAVLAGEPQRAELALDAAHAESAGNADAVEAGEVLLARPRASRHSSDGIHSMLTLVSLANPPARSASVTDRYASGRSMYLPTRPIVTSCFGLVHDVEQLAPARPVDVGRLAVEAERAR